MIRSATSHAKKLLLALALAMVSPEARAVDAAYLQAEAPDVVLDGDIEDKAEELGFDPVRIYEFVRNQISFEIYYGLMKGPEATLRSRSGNDYDQAALLVSMLRAAGIPARFVRGKIAMSTTLASGWTGANSGEAAATIFRYSQPVAWHANELSTTAVWNGTTSTFSVMHIWVEAFVPLGAYRGATGNANQAARGQAWVALDPSFKLRDWRPGPALAFDQPPLQFDYDSYLASIQEKLPVEAFEDQLRNYWADQHPGGSPTSYESASMTGPIRKEIAGFLPTSLPYEFDSSVIVRRHASLIPLHRYGNYDDLSPIPEAGTRGAPDYRYERIVHLCKNNVANCDQKTMENANKLLEARGWSADWNGKRVSIYFPPTASSIPKLKDVGYASCTGTNDQTIHTIPTVAVNGTDHTISENQVVLCAALEVVVETKDPKFPPGYTLVPPLRGPLPPKGFDIKAGELDIASFDEGGPSDAEVEEEAQFMSLTLAVYPIAHDDVKDHAFWDSDRDGVKDANEPYLSHEPWLEELITGQLLHLAHTWYWNRYRKSTRRIAGFHHLVSTPSPGFGRVTSGRDVEYLFDVPFGIGPSNLLIDLAAGTYLHTRNAGGVPANTPAFRLITNDGSALEHAVWEEVAGVGAVSTVQGIQLGLDLAKDDPTKKIELLTIDSPAEATDEVLARCNANGCSKAGTKGLDQTTYCTIRRSFPGVPDPADWGGGCEPAFPGAATKDLRILNRSNFNYDGWTGYVYARFTAESGEMTISQTGNGGFTRMDSYLDPTGGLTQLAYDFDEHSWTPAASNSLNVLSSDPVSVTHGSYYESHTDIDIPGPGGMNLRFVRSYNSRLDHEGMLGHGWATTFDQKLRIENDLSEIKAVWVTENAAEVTWSKPLLGSAFTSDASNHAELVENANGTFTITTLEGLTYRFRAPDSAGLAPVTQITDRNNNTILFHRTASGNLTSVTDAMGRILTLTPLDAETFRLRDWTGRDWIYEVDGGLVRYTDPEGHDWTYAYITGSSNEDLNYNIKKYTKPALRGSGRYVMNFTYYPNDTVYSHWDTLGRETRFSYNFFRKRTDVFNPDGGIESYFYDEYANVTRYQSAEGHVTEYGFEEPETRNRTSEIDPMGYETLLEYDDDGNVKKRTNRNLEVETWTYNAYARPLLHTDALLRKTQFEWDATGVNLKKEYADLNGVNLREIRSHDYDARGNRKSTSERFALTRWATTFFDIDPATGYVVKIRAPEGAETRIVNDPVGRPTRIERDRSVTPGGAKVVDVVEREYDGLNRIVRARDPGGLIREVDYDANGLVEEVRSVVQFARSAPAPRVDQRNVYDAMDRLISSKDALEHVTTFEYDDRDRQIRASTPMGKTVETVYDLDGRVIQTIDPAGATTSTQYDPVGRPIVVTDALGRLFETQYDPEGRMLWKRDAGRVVFSSPVYDDGGAKSTQTFDELGRRKTLGTAVGTAEEATVLFDYDYPGRLVKKTDGNNHTTEITYDDLGRVEVVKDALLRPRTTYVYDEAGNVLSSTDAEGRSIVREYDPRGQVVSEHDVFKNQTFEFTYDRRGRLVWAKNPSTEPGVEGAHETFAYDDLDRRIERTAIDGGTERFVYDDDGQLRQHVQLSAGASPTPMVLNYDYDARGLLTEIRDPQVGTFQFDADELGRPVRRTAPGSEWRAFYTAKGDLDLIHIQWPGFLEVFDYCDFDSRGYPQSILSSEGTTAGSTCEPVTPPPSPAPARTSVTYTTLGRVKTVTYPDGSGELYTYDDAGNRTGILNAADNNQSRRYSYNAADELTQINRFLDGSGPILATFDHDEAGRRTSQDVEGVTSAYEYDGFGRLARVTREGGYDAKLDYGALGRRIKRSEVGGPNVTSTYPTPRLEQRGSSTFRLLRAGAVGSVVAEVEKTPTTGPNLLMLHRDASQNVSTVVRKGPTGNPTVDGSVRRWTAFGTLRMGSSTVERGYASQPVEGNTGLVSMGARHYDPATGRFLQPDPLGVEANELYAYAANNAYMFWDPTGLMPQSMSTGGLLDQRLGFGGGLAVAGAGAAAAVGLGYGVGAALAATGCIASVVCGAAVGIGAVGAVGYDLYNGGASRIASSFSSVWSGNATVGQALETGAVASGFASMTAAGARSAASVALRPSISAATPAATPAVMAGTDLVHMAAAREASQGTSYLMSFLTSKEASAYAANPASGSRFLGQAVHRATNQSLQASNPGRFSYSTRGPDFIDTLTGEIIELTTPGQVGAHAARDAWTNIVTYVLPGP